MRHVSSNRAQERWDSSRFSGALRTASASSPPARAGHHVIPFIISVSREVLLSVPRDQREAAWPGATRWESTWKVVVPFARTGIMGSIFLALARALGETMAVTMVIGNDPTISASLFSPGLLHRRGDRQRIHRSHRRLVSQALIELGLVLFLLTFILNGLARLLIVVTTQRGSGMAHSMSPRLRWRKVVNGFMLTPDRRLRARRRLRSCSSFSGYLVYNGGTSLNWNFFTKLPSQWRSRRRHGQRHRRQRQSCCCSPR